MEILFIVLKLAQAESVWLEEVCEQQFLTFATRLTGIYFYQSNSNFATFWMIFFQDCFLLSSYQISNIDLIEKGKTFMRHNTATTMFHFRLYFCCVKSPDF